MGGQQSCCCAADKDSEKLVPVSALGSGAGTTDEAYSQAAQAADQEPSAFHGAPTAASEAPAAAAPPAEAKDRSPVAEPPAPAKEEVKKAEPAAEPKAATSPPLQGFIKGNEFIVRIERSLETNIGLNLDALDEESAFVDGILPGSIEAWNQAHPSDPRLQQYDRILGVNGLRGHTDTLLREMRQNAVWDLVVHRPIEVKISVDCAKNPTLGLDLKYSPNGGSLLISTVSEGAIREWNQSSSSSCKVGKHDRVIEVNGVRGTARQLLDTATNVTTLDLVILHFA